MSEHRSERSERGAERVADERLREEYGHRDLSEIATAPTVDEVDWRRLNVRMLFIHPVVEVGRAIIPLLAILFGVHDNGGSYWSLAALVAVIARATSLWFTTRYRITDDAIELRRGLLRRRTQVAHLDRVRTVDVTSHALHRVFGLARVAIGTGISDRKGRSDLKLDGLTRAEAERLRDELLHRAPERTDAVTHRSTDEFTILRLDPAWVRYAPFTLSGAVTTAAILGFGWRAANETHANPNQYAVSRDAIRHLRDTPVWQSVVVIAVGVAVFVVLASVVGYILAFWNFTLVRHAGGTVQTRRGLITTRATTIEERRLRGIELSEPLLLRAVGGARTIAIATGLRVGRGAERGGTMLCPPAPSAVAAGVGGAVVQTQRPLTIDLIRHGSRARNRRIYRALVTTGTPIAVAVGLFYAVGGSGWEWTPALALLPIAFLLALDRADSLGHAFVDGYLVTRLGSLIRRRSAVSTEGIIGVTLRTSVFQRRAGLMTVVATTAAGRQAYHVQDVESAEGLRVATGMVGGLLSPFLER